MNAFRFFCPLAPVSRAHAIGYRAPYKDRREPVPFHLLQYGSSSLADGEKERLLGD